MSPERWQKIDRLFHSALELDDGERAAFLAQACVGDERLRQEVESLLASHDQAASFIEVPAADAAAGLLAERHARLRSGTMVNRYKILDLRAEAFNALNRTNLGTPNRFVNTPQFGTITEAATPGREIQLGLRLSF